MTDVTYVTGAAVTADGDVLVPGEDGPPWFATIVFDTRGYAGPLHVDADCYGLNSAEYVSTREMWAVFADTEFCDFCSDGVDWSHRLGGTGGVADD
jgi:hypothetical protein